MFVICVQNLNYLVSSKSDLDALQFKKGLDASKTNDFQVMHWKSQVEDTMNQVFELVFVAGICELFSPLQHSESWDKRILEESSTAFSLVMDKGGFNSPYGVCVVWFSKFMPSPFKISFIWGMCFRISCNN